MFENHSCGKYKKFEKKKIIENFLSIIFTANLLWKRLKVSSRKLRINYTSYFPSEFNGSQVFFPENYQIYILNFPPIFIVYSGDLLTFCKFIGNFVDSMFFCYGALYNNVLLFHLRFFFSFIFKVFKVRQITVKCIHSSHRMDKRKWFQWANSRNLSWYTLVQFRKSADIVGQRKSDRKWTPKKLTIVQAFDLKIFRTRTETRSMVNVIRFDSSQHSKQIVFNNV